MAFCEKTGLEFQARSNRQRNHPQIMAWLSEANKEGWYKEAMAVLETGRAEHLATFEEFFARLQDAQDRHSGRGRYDYRTYRETYQERAAAAIQVYLGAYNEQMPVEEDFRGERSSINLLSRRLIRYCIKPIEDEAGMPTEIALRFRQECLDPVIKPMRDAQEAQQKEKRRLFLESLKSRPVVKEESYTRGAPYAGDYSYFLPEQIILICSFSRFDRAPEDYLQLEDSTFCQFVEPTEEEKLSSDYLQCQQWMQAALQKEQSEKEAQERFAKKRQAELDAIHATGREPDFFEQIFAGTEDH